MDNRLIRFVLVSTMVIMIYSILQMQFFPPEPAPEPNPDDVAELIDGEIKDNQADDDGLLDDADVPNGAPADTATPVVRAEADPGQFVDPQPLVDADNGAAPDLPQPALPQRITFGSLDPNKAPMLVTFNSRGATVERVELSSPRYRTLDDRSAYIGNLGLETTNDPPGLRVNVVGDGTPAHAAGLLVGDVITAIDDLDVVTPMSFESYLRAKSKGDQVTLTVSRAVGELTEGTSSADAADDESAVEPGPEPKTDADSTTPVAANQPVNELAEKRQILTLSVQSMWRPMEVIHPQSDDNVEDPDLLKQQSYLMGLTAAGATMRIKASEVELPQLPSLRDGIWRYETKVEGDTTVIEFRFRLTPQQLEPAGLDTTVEIVKRFSFTPDPPKDEDWRAPAVVDYHFDFDVEVVNLGPNPIEIGYRIDGPTGLPIEGWWYTYKTSTGWGSAGVRDIVFRPFEQRHQMHTNPQILSAIETHEKSGGAAKSGFLQIVGAEGALPLDYLGVDAQYFNSSLLAPADDSNPPVLEQVRAIAVESVDPTRENLTDVTFRVDLPITTVAAQQSSKKSFRIFAGPKNPEILEPYDMGECVVYGWFEPFSKLMSWILHSLYAFVGNYGIAIVLLTVIVKAGMFPMGRQAAMNAKKMQELSPELKKIKEKFPDNTEKQMQAQQELFRKHNYNPLAGCLPLFIQMPIFIGLYRALSVDIELRQTPLIPGIDWASNLAAPDMLLRWDGLLPDWLAGYTGFLGPFLNVFPLISAGSFLIQQKMMTPPALDEQQEAQQRVMMMMPFLMAFMFFKIPAGLCIYFITSGLCSLAERKLLPSKTTAPSSTDESTNGTETKPGRLAGMVASLTGNGQTDDMSAAEKRAEKNKVRRKKRSRK